MKSRLCHILRATLIILLIFLAAGADAQKSALFRNGFSLYGSFGPNKWWSNAEPFNVIGFSGAIGADKHITRWLAFGLDYEFGQLHGDRVVGPDPVFTTKTAYSKLSFIGYFDLVSVFVDPTSSPFELRFFGGASYVLGTIDLTEHKERDWRSYYDLVNTPNAYAQFTYAGGISLEIDVSQSISLFTKVVGTIEPTDEMDGVGYLTAYATDDARYEYYDFDKNLWVRSTKAPSKDELKLNWYDNFATVQIGVRYHISKFGGKTKTKRKKRSGPRDNHGRFKILPKKYHDFLGPDGMERN